MKKKIIKTLIIITLFWAAYTITSNAAISSGNKTVNSGEKASISIKSNIPLIAYTLEVTNQSGLTILSTTGGTPSKNKKIITDAATPDSPITTLTTFVFDTPNVIKDTNYTVSFRGSKMEDTSFSSVADDTTTATITVKAPSQTTTQQPSTGGSSTSSGSSSSGGTSSSTSSNANLTALSISPGALEPAFNKTRKNYTAYVNANVNEVKVSATKEDSKAKYVVSGNKNLKAGENEVVVTVTAQDGTKNTYKIIVVKEEGLDLTLSTLKIEGLTLSPEFKSDVYNYTAQLTKDLKELKVTAIATRENTPVEVTGHRDIKEGENIITILLKSPDGSETKTYKIVVNKDLSLGETEEALETAVLGITDENGEDSLFTREQVIIIDGIIIAFISITTIVIIIYLISDVYLAKRRKENSEQNENVQKDDLEGTNTIEELYTKKTEKNLEDNLEKEEISKQDLFDNTKINQDISKENNQDDNVDIPKKSDYNIDFTERRKYRRDDSKGGKHF